MIKKYSFGLQDKFNFTDKRLSLTLLVMRKIGTRKHGIKKLLHKLINT